MNIKIKDILLNIFTVFGLLIMLALICSGLKACNDDFNHAIRSVFDESITGLKHSGR